ncbi:MAG TPA: ATP-binding protein [Ktedonobacterales bacterium]|jgi:signal transduction histidine kinase|nr:ATP-binding protein [Ktedonobacterales bacterium]
MKHTSLDQPRDYAPDAQPQSAVEPARRLWRQARDRVTLRQRLTLWYTAFLCATLLGFSVLMYTAVQLQLMSAIHTDIQDRAGAIAVALQRAQQRAPESMPVVPTPTAPRATSTSSPHSATPVASATIAVTPVPTPDAATSAAIQKQLALSASQALGQLDIGFEVLNSQGKPQYFAPALNGVSLPLDNPLVTAVLRGAPGDAYTTRAGASLLEIYVEPIVLPASGAASVTGTTAARSTSATASASASATTAPPDTSASHIVGVVLVARSLDGVSGTLATLSRLLIFGDLACLILVSLGGWFIAKRSLRPLATVTHTARAIANNAQGAGLGLRIPYAGPRDEVGTLAATFNDMLDAIERVTTTQRQFVADASHELRTPITNIKGTLELLLSQRQSPHNPSLAERTAMLRDAYTEAESMADLINDLLLLARADAAAREGGGSSEPWIEEQIRGRREPVELDQLVMKVFRHARAQAHARHLDLLLAVDRLEPVTVIADPGRIRQLTLIFLDNATKYTPAGGQIFLSVERRGDRAALSVTDTGIGIPADAMPHIFERFYRSDRARARAHVVSGSGLGLAIARWIAESIGGTITVRSQPGKGSTFTLLLPLQPDS